ncbi:MAG: D-alanyl-D-alanine carboxypeptidase/D-alanyl-D-alanine-endopeptidase [Planctomycetes bacterium]|nr:D-alanyl-D-alanine carboxypeptidase/D-alanyl-D-alanine-endopeptidase [Planctomycetota bacterium]
MKRCVVAIPVLLFAGCAASPGARLATSLAAYDDHPVQVAALVVDLDSGATLLARETRRLFRPASTMKLLTTAAVCRRDPDGTFETRLATDALPVGQLTLEGGGDPLLATADLRVLVDDLHAQGLTGTRGALRIVDPLVRADRFGVGWMWDDEPSTFQPALSAAIVDGGCVRVQVEGDGTQLAAALLPVAGELELRVRGDDRPLRVTRGRYREPAVVTVTGHLDPGGPKTREITVPEPARFSGHVLADACRRAGIALERDEVAVVETAGDATPTRAAEAVRRRSVAEVVVHTNKVSDNLGAELLLRHLGAFRQPDPVALGADSERAGIAVVATDLAALGFDAGSFRAVDGSGVSHYDLLSADLLVGLLVDMHRRGGSAYELFRRSLPIAGVDGTLATRMRDTAASERVFAKTGTVSGVSNLAGYIDTRSGRRLAFAILCQNFVGSARPWRELQDQICADLAAY